MINKKTLICFYFLVSMLTAYAQNQSIDTLIHKVAAEKNDDLRFELLNDFFSNTAETNPMLELKNAQKLLDYSQNSKDKLSEAFALCRIGYSYRIFGNTEKFLEYLLKANDLAKETKNGRTIAFISQVLGHVYKDQADYSKAYYYYKKTADIGESINNDKAKAWGYSNLSDVYLSLNKLDSALMYSQREYEISMRIHYFDFIGYTYLSLGDIQGKLGNAALALGYYDMAVAEGLKIRSPKLLNWTFTSKAQYFNNTSQKDSSIIYAKKAIAIVQNTPFKNLSIKPAKLLLELYKNNNSDSALKYSEIYRIANDSLFNSKIIQQTQLMTFENELRQQEIAAEKTKAEYQRKQNIQFALIALGIITFFILFLILSRSFITNTKLIEFFGIIALLIVFEFINLWLHPFLESVTHHSPLLMLLALVSIAALLVPMHHRIEKWATKKLVEKNKAIRLVNAKKTIAKLEGNP